ncbi:ATP-binding protein [Aeromonas sp. MR7]|uniref:ATP-dependent nuclease n=1 Tax=Aeromonas sp. MR7 TaxID=2923419 RepID=UPI001F4A1B97|nr:ATP-binding protein [Aeromonas sp. MR7]MCH7349566.1 AAA family ATPase [Aeromonas sp. MR7]
MDATSIKISDYKCFKNQVGFDSIKRVNVIIGRNNSGKSSILDIIEIMVSPSYGLGGKTKLIIGRSIDEEAIRKTFYDNHVSSTIAINHRNDFEYGMRFLGRKIIWSEGDTAKSRQRTLLYVDDGDIHPHLNDLPSHRDSFVTNVSRPFQGKVFKRLFAERDIKPEPSTDGLAIAGNGQGLTNTIQNFINRADLPSDLVESKLLDGLNAIFSHDAHFVDIVCQLHNDSKEWEIYLEEKNKGRVQLSKSGSGLKTVISVLSFLILIPHLERRPLEDFIFGFEELENNIHPSLLRRLNTYIYNASIENDFVYFITTHSNILIDQFSKQDNAQIIHVSQKDGESTCTVARTYFDNHGILDDLDVRASDILQANGIIWVEGPSDRIYINRWIEIVSNGELREGTHYQVVFYGGRLLSHLSAISEADKDNGVSILKANRNAAILIDSDKRNKSSRINDTKKRIISEFEDIKAFCWLTKGKEIENYIPTGSIKNAFGISHEVAQVEQYENFFDYLEGYLPSKGKSYESRKTILASQLIPFMTEDMLKESLDLYENLLKLCNEIKKWNR